ncbi:MAG TPA: RAMP superfamily CRISPR-associated protein, partial [Longimicrobium sp.]|nr:RAMP superfamily CRISPR-associated protein [Longimicrobium sp.]
MTTNGTLRAEFRVRLEREYHVGAGHGRGTAVDSALFTDAPGGVETPVIRYGHGVLRQAVHDLLAAGAMHPGLRRCRASGGDPSLDYCIPGGGPEPNPCPVCRIFGSAAAPSRWSFSTLTPVTDEPPPLPRQGARVVSRASIDPRRRRAADATLFSEELGAPLTFSFSAEHPADGDEARDELALLLAAARCVGSIGADRRRGRGECSIELVERGDLDPGALLARFEEAWLSDRNRLPRAAAEPSPRTRVRLEGTASAGVWAEARAADRWEEVRLVVRLDEPVIAGSRPLTGNVLEGETFVSGTVLLGAFASHALARGAREDESAFLRVFRAGAVRFPDLLPVVDQGETCLSALPAPRDLFTCLRRPGPAEAGGHGIWSALLRADGGRSCPVCGEEAKPQRVAGYLSPVHRTPGGPEYRAQSRLGEETKIQIDPRTGRVREGSLYHRQTIHAGALLAGTLRATREALADLRRWGLLGEDGGVLPLRMGKRHGRGYGAVRLAWSVVPPDDAERRRTAVRERVERLIAAGVPVPLVATSRLLLRDGLGRVLQRLSPIDLGLPGEGTCAVSTRQVGGFWRHVGLPRQQELALEPGSVLVVHAGGADPARLGEALLALALGRSVGERAAEGFGCMAVAPFPYGWADAAYASSDPAFDPLPVPAALRLPAREPGGRGLRHDPREE